jgi:hypothetical protein
VWFCLPAIGLREPARIRTQVTINKQLVGSGTARAVAERVLVERVDRVLDSIAGGEALAVSRGVAIASSVAEVVGFTTSEMAVGGISDAGDIGMIVEVAVAAGVVDAKLEADVLAIASGAETKSGLNNWARAVLVAAATAMVSSSRKAF